MIIIITLFIEGTRLTVWTLTNLRPSPRLNWNLEVLIFVEGGKLENPEKSPRSKERTNNKFNPHETAITGIELESQRWDWGERLSTAPPVLPDTYHVNFLYTRITNLL